MYCSHCGTELPADSCICTVCGNLSEEKMKQESEPQIDIVDKVLDYVEKNRLYFALEFTNIRCAQPGKFNWSAFLFNIFYCLYRKQYAILSKYFKWLIIFAIVLFDIFPIYLWNALMNGEFIPMMKGILVMMVLSGGLLVWYFIANIRLGKNFNRLYYNHLMDVLVEKKDRKKHTGVSIKNIFLGMVLHIVVTSISLIMILSNSILSFVPYILSHDTQNPYEEMYNISEEDYISQEEDPIDENEVIYGYNDYDAGIDIDEDTVNAIVGEYNLGNDLFMTVDEDWNLDFYTYDEWLFGIEMWLWDMIGDIVVLEGYFPEEYWDELSISEDDAAFQLEFKVKNGRVTNIYTNGEEAYFEKIN